MSQDELLNSQPDPDPPTRRKVPFLIWVLLGIALGVLLGYFLPQGAPHYKDASNLFIQSIKMLVSPLLLVSIVLGLCSSTGKQAGKLLGKALLWFWLATSVALFIGLGAANLAKPGVGAPKTESQSAPKAPEKKTWVEQLVPSSAVKAMAENQVLPLVFFSILFGFALSTLGNRALPLIAVLQSVNDAMFKLASYVMYLVPIGVAGAIAHAISSSGGIGVFRSLFLLVGTLYAALVVFVLVLLLAVKLLTRANIGRVLFAIKDSLLLAFSSASSESVLPQVMASLEKLGVPSRIVRLVIPTGYSFNLDGTTLYLSLAAMFLAQASGKTMTMGAQLVMMITLLVASKGVAAVPRASLLVLTSICTQFGLEPVYLISIVAVDTFMDMARTSVNVLGNSMATLVVGTWEKAIPKDAPCLR